MLPPLRSVLYVPASNAKALAKLPALACDAAIIDLEDAVHPDQRAQARQTLLAAAPALEGRRIIIRINRLDGPWGEADLDAAMAVAPHAILLPKAGAPQDINDLADALDRYDDAPPRIWAMIETPRGILNAAAMAELGHHHSARLECFVAGTNDLMKETGVCDADQLQPWLMQIVLAAKAGGLAVLDGVHNDFRDSAGFEAACQMARNRGFDGKTLIHPSQIDVANMAFAPDAGEVAAAQAVIAAFALPENAGKGVIEINGKMTERLHLAMAEAVVARAIHSKTE